MNTTAARAWPAPSAEPIRPDTRVNNDARDNPYVGPRALGTEDPIYGRAREIANVRGLLVAHRIVLLYSPSGAGKTSLIEAGLRPEMEGRGYVVLPTIRVGHELTTAAGGLQTNRYSSSVIASLEERLDPAAQLTPDQLAAADLQEYLTRLGESEPDQKWCLFFDQFEELFTMNPADVDAKKAFLAQLGAVMKNRNFWVLIAMREDFIAHLDPHVDVLPSRLRTRFRLGLLSPDAAKEAARAPAAATEVEFEEAAVEQLIDDLRRIQVQHFDRTTVEPGPHIEPLQLQVVCRRLWTPSATSIGIGDLEKLGGVDQALADYYRDELEKTVEKTSVSEKALRDWFDTDLITADGYRKPVREGPGRDGKKVLEILEKAYLVRRDRRNGTDWYELTHDRIVNPIRDSNRRFSARRRARRRRVIAIAALVAVVVGAVALFSVADRDGQQLMATDAAIPSTINGLELESDGLERFLIAPDVGDVIEVTLSAEAQASTSAKLRLVRVVNGQPATELESKSLRVVESGVSKDQADGLDAVSLSLVVTELDSSLVVEVSSQPGGRFRLDIAPIDPEVDSSAEGEIRTIGDEPWNGSIETAGVVDTYTLAAGEGGDVRFVVTPADDSENGFDAIVTLLGGDAPVVQDSRGPGQTETVLANLAADRQYQIDVSGYEGSTGEFTVLFERVTSTALPIDGTAVDGRIAAAGDVMTYAVSSADGGDVRIELDPSESSESGLDSIVIVRDEDGQELTYEDSAGSGDSELVVVGLAPGRTYSVEVSGYEGSSGDFILWAERITATPLVLDAEPIEGTIATAGDIVTYAITIPGGVELGEVVVVADPDLDVAFEVSTPFGSSYFDDEGAGQTEGIDFEGLGIGAFPDDQRWLVSVSSSGDSTGDYEIFVTTAG